VFYILDDENKIIKADKMNGETKKETRQPTQKVHGQPNPVPDFRFRDRRYDRIRRQFILIFGCYVIIVFWAVKVLVFEF
jgi:hypothetical protein